MKTANVKQEMTNLNLKRKPISFSMNVPEWYKNISIDKKCEIVETLAEKLKNEPVLTEAEKEELITIE
jgi:hypothetical protein